MGRFVKHFTTLDFAQWQQRMPRFRLDGPGRIEDVARFCSGQHSPEIENRPNFGNTLVAVSKTMTGCGLEKRELKEAIRGAGDCRFWSYSSSELTG